MGVSIFWFVIAYGEHYGPALFSKVVSTTVEELRPCSRKSPFIEYHITCNTGFHVKLENID